MAGAAAGAGGGWMRREIESGIAKTLSGSAPFTAMVVKYTWLCRVPFQVTSSWRGSFTPALGM